MIRWAPPGFGPLFALGAAPANPAAPWAGKKVAILGDSHTEMLGPMLSHQVKGDGGKVVAVIAKRGWSTADFNSRTADWLSKISGVDMVIVPSLGTNDALKMAPSAVAGQTSALEAKFRSAGAKEILWGGPPTIQAQNSVGPTLPAKVDAVAATQASTVPGGGARWFDNRALSAAGPYQKDGIHRTGQGYRNWASAIVANLTSSATPPNLGITPIIPGVDGTVGLVIAVGGAVALVGLIAVLFKAKKSHQGA